ncbi:hypothetical protein ACIRQQ_00970 [Streptomyces fuscichromogenes]|uniref:CIS tube protein n=1 Tax=Streptomyces fuscichromogenes TaxID=1324013 RepID=UPI00380C8D39
MVTPEMLQQGRAALTPVRVAKLGPARSTDAEYIKFDFNPATITISHTAQEPMSAGSAQKGQKGAGSSAPKASAPRVVLAAQNVEEQDRARGTTSIALRALTFNGRYTNVAAACRRLLDWSHYVTVTDRNATSWVELPRLRFVWGTQIYLVYLKQVTVTYTRFSQSGAPVRAVVDLTLHSIPSAPGPTNPSSGGLAGRRTHLLAGAESLPELATRCYGGPGRWREIAAANGFDDPLRVRPGTRVYLPGAQEGAR